MKLCPIFLATWTPLKHRVFPYKLSESNFECLLSCFPFPESFLQHQSLFQCAGAIQKYKDANTAGAPFNNCRMILGIQASGSLSSDSAILGHDPLDFSGPSRGLSISCPELSPHPCPISSFPHFHFVRSPPKYTTLHSRGLLSWPVCCHIQDEFRKVGEL